MVAFRKLYPVLAVFALFVGAQSASAQLTCNATAGVPPVVRAEGFTELVGDIVISCTGGNTVAPFLANFQVFMNTNVTSRLVTSSLSEALLTIDEPGTAVGGGAVGNALFCASPDAASNGAGIAPGTVAPSAAGCNPAPTAANGVQTGTYNVFRAQRAADIAGGSRENSLVWTNIPIVPPGTTGSLPGATRTFRITNLRANASGVGPGGLGLPGQIVAFISISGISSLALNNPQQIVGYVQPGLQFDVRNAGNTDSGSFNIDQCVSPAQGEVGDLFGDPTADKTVAAVSSFRFREGFQSAFKPRIVLNQNGANPGSTFNSESGFVRSVGGTTVGLADTGTRLAVRFSNVPANLRIFVSTTNGRTSSDAPRAVLVSTDVNGSGGTFVTSETGAVSTSLGIGTSGYLGPKLTYPGNTDAVRAAEVPIVNGTGLAVWEIVAPEQLGFAGNSAANDNTTLAGVNETLFFPYAAGYRYQSGTNQVGLGTGTVIGSFAPFYAAAGTMSQVLPIPRFTMQTTTTNFIRIQACQTNLLFPYVTNWAGFDTGIAIANTSDDPFSDPNNRRQAGRCRMNYFGRLPNGNAPTTLREETDREVASGETITMVLSSGGGLGLRGNANFQGYIIAQCDFRFAHGFAFITDGPIGQARVAEGYLALVLDGADAGRVRGQSSGEVRGH